MTTIERPRATPASKPNKATRGDTKLPPANDHLSPSDCVPGEPNLTNSHKWRGLHSPPAVGDQLPPAIRVSKPKIPTPGDSSHTSSHGKCDTQGDPAACANFPDSQCSRGPHIPLAVGDSTSTDSQPHHDTQAIFAVRGPILADPLLGMAADVVGDLEMVRIANENRLRTLTATDEHGHGLSIEHPDVAQLRGLVDALVAAEKHGVKNLQKVMKRHPLGPWVKAHNGVGEKQAARLLASIRDPYWNDLHERPRTVSELWAYCGLHVVHTSSHGRSEPHSSDAAGVAPHRQRGQKSNWSEDARKRAWLIAASCIKQKPENSEYRRVYDEARIKYAESTHPSECVRCGPKGKPALVGSPLSLGHQHARAMRLMSKAILKDLWIEAKRLHEEQA